MKRLNISIFLLSIILIIACENKIALQEKSENNFMAKTQNNSKEIRYVAIGDSYTIGEGALPHEAWPNVLANHLRDNGVNITLAANPSKTGWTSQQAIDFELPVYRRSKPDFATLLIGVNDYVQGVDKETFRKKFSFLIDGMLKELPSKENLIIITIPDFFVTPAGKLFANGKNISKKISEFNDVIKEESQKRGLTVVDIFDLSKEMGKNKNLIAKDGLHPSADEYLLWEQKIYPVALEILKK